jgi:hypothetical protein
VEDLWLRLGPVVAGALEPGERWSATVGVPKLGGAVGGGGRSTGAGRAVIGGGRSAGARGVGGGGRNHPGGENFNCDLTFLIYVLFSDL